MRVLVFLALLSPASAFFRGFLSSASRLDVSLQMKRAPSLMKGKRKVILIKDITNIGKANDVITVKNGFYMNYLLPRSLATTVTTETLEKISATLKAKEDAAAAALATADTQKSKIEAVKSVVVKKKVGENGNIFGSVSAVEFITAVEKASGILLGSPKVSFADISAVGSYDAEITLHPDVKAKISISVVSEK